MDLKKKSIFLFHYADGEAEACLQWLQRALETHPREKQSNVPAELAKLQNQQLRMEVWKSEVTWMIC